MKSFYFITQCSLCGTRFRSQDTHTEEQVENSRAILKDAGGSNLLDFHDCENGDRGTLLAVGYALTTNVQPTESEQ